MCTYSISINDSVMENVRPAFPDEESLSRWMQQQMEQLMIRYAATQERPTAKPQKLSQRLRGIATAPNNQELETIHAGAKEEAGNTINDQITPGVSRLIRGNALYISDEELDQMRYEYLMEKYK